MKVGIVGSRSYPRLDLVAEFVNSLPPDSVIISGGARGVDCAAVQAAKVRGLAFKIHYPDWEGQGKKAGFLRNRLIVGDATALIAFWDRKSKGTAHTINLARIAGKLQAVIGPDGEEIE